MEAPLNDTITIPRTSAEALMKLAHRVLDMADETGPGNLERAEVAMINNQRNSLKEAVFQTEKAIYENDTKPLTVESMSRNAERLRSWEDSFSDDKANFIEGRRR
jgi:hypothetical protein